MIAMLLSMLALQDAGVTRMNGRCEYPPAVAEHQDDTLLALCDSVAIDRDGEAATFEFSRKSGAARLLFSGTMSGQRMTISGVRLRSGSPLAATGTCEIFYAEGRPSMVACLAEAGPRRFAANFRPSRF